MKNLNSQKIIETVMDGEMSIQDVLRAASDLTDDYLHLVLTSQEANKLAIKARDKIIEAIKILDKAAAAENEESNINQAIMKAEALNEGE